jgi:hypothetical protein
MARVSPLSPTTTTTATTTTAPTRPISTINDTVNAESFSLAKDRGKKTDDQILFEDIIIYCLDTIKIKDVNVQKKALASVQDLHVNLVKKFGKWVLPLKVMTTACEVNNYIFAQSQLFYFLTLAIKGVDQEKIGSELVEDITFYTCKDILDNYESFPVTLKLLYPGIVVDIISILIKGIDTKGRKENLDSIPRYLESRKLLNSNSNNNEEVVTSEIL